MRLLRPLTAAAALALASAAFAQDPVDINTADAETLATAIDGVGLKRAEAIIDWRERNGPFGSVDELVEVRGIGDHILESNRERLRTGAAE